MGEGGVQESREPALLGGARLPLAAAPGAGEPLGKLGPRSTRSLALSCGRRTAGPPAMGECSGPRAGAGRPGTQPRSGWYGKKASVCNPPASVVCILTCPGNEAEGTRWHLEARAARGAPGRSLRRGRNKEGGFPGHLGPRVCPRCSVPRGEQVEEGHEKRELRATSIRTGLRAGGC